MAERMVLGVDFSGAGENTDIGKTWVTKGLFDGETLKFEICYAISRKGLEDLLKSLCQEKDAVAAMDFPFGVPMEFAQLWTKSACLDMPSLWEKAADTDFSDFLETITPEASQLLRVGDLAYSNASPCLHLGPRVRMVNMTFKGMQMLHRLWVSGRVNVPPLIPDKSNQHLPVLLEVMPGAALRAFELPFTRYKDGKGDTVLQERRKAREKILGELDGASQIQLEVPDEIRNKCIDDRGGDALDSLVAAIVAAKWAKNESDFLVPSDEVVDTLKRNKRNKRRASQQAMGKRKIEVARREGWIYTPLPN